MGAKQSGINTSKEGTQIGAIQTPSGLLQLVAIPAAPTTNPCSNTTAMDSLLTKTIVEA